MRLVASFAALTVFITGVGASQEVINRQAYPISGVVGGSVVYRNPRVSPGGGEWLSYEVVDGGAQMQYVVNLSNGKSIEVTTQRSQMPLSLEPGSRDGRTVYGGGMVWCPKLIGGEQWFVFVGSRDGNVDIYGGKIEHPEVVYRLTSDGAIDDQAVWSPDGEMVAFTSRRSGGADIYVLHDMPELLGEMERMGEENKMAGDVLESGRWLERVSNDEREEVYPAWLPGGKAVVYTQAGGVGEKWRSRLLVKYIAEKREVEIARDTVRVMRNVSVSPDGQWMAYYLSLGMNPGEVVSMVVGQVQYEMGEVVRLKTKWPRGVRRFQEVEERIDGGPYWTGEGSLLLLNDKRGKRNVVYEIPSKEFGKDVEPQMIQHEFIAEKGQEYAIRAVETMSGPSEGDLLQVLFVAQKGESFEILSPKPTATLANGAVPPVQGVERGYSIGLSAKFAMYVRTELDSISGSVSPEAGVGGYLRYWLSREWSVGLEVYHGYLKVRDDKTDKEVFAELAVGLALKAGYSFNFSKLFVTPNVGMGCVFLHPSGTQTFGFPIGLEFGYDISGKIALFGEGELTVYSGNLSETGEAWDSVFILGVGLAYHF
jgi:hypothetical protein